MTQPTPRNSAYRDIAQWLRQQIAQGAYGSDFQLPTETDLAAKYKVSRQTVRRAMHAVETPFWPNFLPAKLE